MADLQLVIDTICARVTVEFMHGLIRSRLKQGPFRTDEILAVIQDRDRSLDSSSARLLAEAALEELAERGELRLKGDEVCPSGS